MEKRVRGGVITDLAKTKGLSVIPNDLKSKEIAENLKYRILNDEVDILTAMAFLKKLAKIAEILLADKEVKAKLEREVDELLPQLKNKPVLGVSIGEGTYSRMDYSQCGHPEYNEILDIERQLSQRKKQIEAELALFYKEIEDDIKRLEKIIEDSQKALETTDNQDEINKLHFEINQATKALQICREKQFETTVRKIPKLSSESSGEIVNVVAPIKNSQKTIRFTT